MLSHNKPSGNKFLCSVSHGDLFLLHLAMQPQQHHAIRTSKPALRNIPSLKRILSIEMRLYKFHLGCCDLHWGTGHAHCSPIIKGEQR